MSDEQSVRGILDLSFPEFAPLFLSIVGTAIGLLAGAYRVLSQDLSGDSATVLSGVTAVVTIAFLFTLYNRARLNDSNGGNHEP